jgi:uncharacterized ferredoxin-like protein
MKLNPEKDAVGRLAEEILVAARTAPKAKGKDDIKTAILDEEGKKKVIAELKKLASKRHSFERDAGNLEQADACVLIGVKYEYMEPLGLNCGACGFDCESIKEAQKTDVEYAGPICAVKLMDLGIAVGSAVRRAQELCLDNRIMYTIGSAARKAELMDAQVVLGIPLSIKGKNIFFDRK